MAPLAIVLLVSLVAAGCSVSPDESEGRRRGTSQPSSTVSTEPSTPGRLVALGGEPVLADLLALDLIPVASTAFDPDAGFRGIDHDAVGTIEVLDPAALTTEQLSELEPETVVASEMTALSLGLIDDPQRPLIVVPDGLAADQQLLTLAEELGRVEQAALLIGYFDGVRADALSRVPDGCRMSVVTVDPDATVWLWADTVEAIPRTMADLGCELVAEPAPPRSGRATTTTTDPADRTPDPHELLLARADDRGRVALELADDEELALLSGALLVALQPGTGAAALDGTDDLLEDLEALTDDIDGWEGVAAVADDRVVILDPDMFPGLHGRITLIELLMELVEEEDLFEP